jgi:hypothetical protein
MNYEITWECTDGDWVWRRSDFEDYHNACTYALRRCDERTDPRDKLHGARVIRIAPMIGPRPVPGWVTSNEPGAR